MKREEIFEYVNKQYGSIPEYLWRSSPESAILRHKNGKWYAAIMRVEKFKLGLKEDGMVEIINVKCEPDMAVSYTHLDVYKRQGMITSNSILFAVIFILMFVICGYLLIHNIFDISVMQDVRQYGLLRTLGTSTRQIKKIVNRQAVMLTLIGLPIRCV